MANLQLYAVSRVILEGGLLTEHAECTMTRNSNASPVRTMGKGFAGVSPGAPDCEIDVQNAVPSADFEIDPGRFILENTVVEIQIEGPLGKRAVAKGFIMTDTFSQGVGKEAMLSFKLHCQMPEWQ